MDIIPLNSEKLFPNPDEVQPMKASEKISPYGKEKKEPDKKKPAPATEKETEKGKSKEVGKGDIVDLEA